MKKVVVTGMGAVTAIGCNVSDYWTHLIEGKCGICEITRISIEHHESTVAAQVDDGFEELLRRNWKKRQLNPTTKSVRMGLLAADEAVADSGLLEMQDSAIKIGTIWGVIDNCFRDAELDTPQNLTLKQMPSVIPAMLSIRYGWKGPSFNLSNACASSAYAIALAKQMIERGVCDIVVIGGISNLITHDTIQGFNQLLAMSTNPDPNTACRPFTKDRDGFVMGEGGGCMVLESEESALKRGVRIYARVIGCSMVSEAYSMTAPLTNGAGMAESMREALEDASLEPQEIDYINAHGTSTNLNDLYETMAIKTVFGEHARKLCVSSTKSAIGHTLAAGGVLEAIACVKALDTDVIPPTIHYDEADPELDLDYVPNQARHQEIQCVMSNSFGFGGHNASLIFQKVR